MDKRGKPCLLKGNRPVAPVRSPKAEPGFILLLWLQHTGGRNRGEGERKRSDVIAGFEHGGRCHEPRNANGVQKLVEARKYIPL